MGKCRMGKCRYGYMSHGYMSPNQNSPNSDIQMKQASNLPFLGIVKDKKWCPFFHSGVRGPIFLHPKSVKMPVFGCKKIGFSDARSKKRTPLFVVNYTQNWWTRHLFHMNITIGLNFENCLFQAHFWPISPYKIPKSKPYAALGQFLR